MISKINISGSAMCFIFYKVIIAVIISFDKFTNYSILADEADLRIYLADNNKKCEVPNFPPHTKYYILSPSETKIGTPGEYWPASTGLLTYCDNNYKIEPPSDNITSCWDGNWEPKKCLRSCPPLISSTSTNVTCQHDQSLLYNCDNPVENTIAIVTCNSLYHKPIVNENPLRSCKSGKWSPALSLCVPQCGVKRSKATVNIVGGKDTVQGDYPWQVAVYTDHKKFICGGSIIKLNIVLSAAHCFCDDDGNRHSPENYLLAAGKFYSGYDDKRDLDIQRSNVSKIFIPERYKGKINYLDSDISVLILTTPFILTVKVQPVCIELDDEILSLDSLPETKKGIVTGWGNTLEGKDSISNSLQEIEIPYIKYPKCINEVPAEFQRFITADKICGGYINNSRGVCSGDSGGGLVFSHKLVFQQYYIKGIVSSSPSSNIRRCDINQYSVYTAVKKHTVFINNVLIKNQLLESLEVSHEDHAHDLVRCILPNFPPNGKYTTDNQKNTYNPGEYVPQASVLSLTCDATYTSDLEPLSKSICSETGQWAPPPGKCLGTCPTLISSTSTNVKCEYNGKPLKNCENPKEGTKALLSCKKSYEESSLQTNPIRLCAEGKWNPSIPQCYPMCGDPSEIHEKNSWHVGIYNTDKEFLCGGSIIINTKFVLTAAHCLSDSDGVVQSAENYLVAAGKHYRKYNDQRDTDAQYSTIIQIFIKDGFRGRINYYAFDIAILILRDPFTPSKVVQPVCLDQNETSRNLDTSIYNNGAATITGWGYIKKTRNFSDVLKEKEISYIPYNKCVKKLNNYFTFDKICAESTNADTIVCKGDNGGGLVFYNLHDERFYIKGIASITSTPEGDQCDFGELSIYTSVASYKDFFKDSIANHL